MIQPQVEANQKAKSKVGDKADKIVNSKSSTENLPLIESKSQMTNREKDPCEDDPNEWYVDPEKTFRDQN